MITDSSTSHSFFALSASSAGTKIYLPCCRCHLRHILISMTGLRFLIVSFPMGPVSLLLARVLSIFWGWRSTALAEGSYFFIGIRGSGHKLTLEGIGAVAVGEDHEGKRGGFAKQVGKFIHSKHSHNQHQDSPQLSLRFCIFRVTIGN